MKPIVHVLVVVFLLAAGVSASDEPTILKKTYVYKTVGDCQIKADVHRLPGDDIRPAIVWIHGGALIMGSREAVRFDPQLSGAFGTDPLEGVPQVLDDAVELGFRGQAVVDGDHRVARLQVAGELLLHRSGAESIIGLKFRFGDKPRRDPVNHLGVQYLGMPLNLQPMQWGGPGDIAKLLATREGVRWASPASMTGRVYFGGDR